MRIALVTPIAPYPPDSGSKIRMYHLLRLMVDRGFRFFMICYDPNAPSEVPPFMRNWFEEIRIIRPPALGEKISWTQKWAHRLIGSPFEPRPSLSRKLNHHLVSWKPDFIQIEKTIGTAYLDLNNFRNLGIPLVLEEGGVHHLSYEREASIHRSRTDQWLFRRRSKRLKRYESKITDQVDAVIAVSRPEADRIKEMNPRVLVLLVPNGVDEKVFHEKFVPFSERYWAAFFCGNLNYKPNIDAVRLYIDEIMPKLKARGISADFVVAGGNVPETLSREASANSQIRLLGYVKEIEPYLKKYAIFVNPMRLGGGTRLKMLEAMAHGMACVSTSIGAEGLAVEDQKHALMADDPESFADKVSFLLSNRKKAEELGKSARALAAERYPWPKCAEPLISYYLGGKSEKLEGERCHPLLQR